MVGDWDWISFLVDTVSVFLITIGISGCVSIYSLHLRIPKCILITIMAIKLLLVDVGIGICWEYFCQNDRKYHILLSFILLIGSLFMIFFTWYASRDELLKVVIVILTGNYLTMLCRGIVTLPSALGWIKGRQEEGLELLGVACVVFVRKWGLNYGIFEKIKKYQLRDRSFWIIFSVGSWMLSLGCIREGLWEGKQLYWLKIGLTMLVMAGYMIYQKVQQEHLVQENQLLIQQQNLMQEYHARIGGQISLTSRMHQDIDRHMELLEELSICCQKKERIDNEERDNICYCKDIVVDSVIYNKVRTCRESGIQTKISMEDFDKGNISDLEILGLLYNLFDNAIEACQRVKEGERFIEISAVKVAGRLMLTIRNSMREVEVRNGRLVTSKKNKDFHGVGLGIIEDFVKKHRGVMKIKAKDGVFEVDIGVEIW